MHKGLLSQVGSPGGPRGSPGVDFGCIFDDFGAILVCFLLLLAKGFVRVG